MTDPTGRTAEEIFDSALSLPTERRRKFVVHACGQDFALRDRILRMLELVDEHPELIEVPPDPTGEERCAPTAVGRYEIVAAIGRGGMGIVYRAWDPVLEREVALKTLRSGLAASDRFAERFRREAKHLSALDHPGVARLFSIELANDEPFITMELLHGPTLAEMLKDGPLTLSSTLHHVEQIADALAAAHSRGIAHLDLKPSNVVVTAEHRVVLLDFGIARVLSQSALLRPADELGASEMTLPFGTPGYMSPEQQVGHPVDASSDSWALGVVLYECLTGRKPTSSRTDFDLLPGSTPPRIVSLIRACLSERPERRPPSRSIQRTVRGERNPRPRQVGRLAIGIVAAVAVLAIVVALAIRPSPDPAVVELIAKDTLQATDAGGRTLWTKTLRRAKKNGWEPFRPQTIVRKDGRAAGVVIQTGATPSGNASILHYLDPTSGSPRWKRPASWVAPVNFQGTLEYRWSMSVESSNGEQMVAAGLKDTPWYGSCVEFLTLDGKEVGRYYHPGAIIAVEPIENPATGARHLLLVGVNNSARFTPDFSHLQAGFPVGCLALIDPDDLGGQAYPHGAIIGRDWPGLPAAREAAYVLVPPLGRDSSSKLISVSVRVRNGETVISATPEDGRLVEFSADLTPMRNYVPVDAPGAALRARGEMHELPFIHVRRGTVTRLHVPVTP